MKEIKIASCQKYFSVGSLEENYKKIVKERTNCHSLDVDICIFSELCISGYPPEDLILKPAFVKKNQEIIDKLVQDSHTDCPAVVVGWPRMGDDKKIYNSAAIIDNGKCLVVDKFHLPNYGVFDESRVFSSGNISGPILVRGIRIGLMICEDAWYSDVSESLLESGAQILVAINGSPYDHSKEDERLSIAVSRVTETSLPLIYVNQVGGQDELVFDGASFVLDSNSNIRSQCPSWLEYTSINKILLNEGEIENVSASKVNNISSGLEAKYQAMVMGLSHYVKNNNFKGVVLGLSGGIDSALSTAIAVDALGNDNVRGVRMPSSISSEGSLKEAEETAKLLNIELKTIDISNLVDVFEKHLGSMFEGLEKDTTEENIQSRIRGVLLMAISNKFGEMLVSTGNKSEISVGYTTIYGDMNGGFNVLKDAYKTDVYSLARWRNKNFSNSFKGPNGIAIPKKSISKSPSAELSPNQKDQDNLPPYDMLDQILKMLIEEEKSVRDIISSGYDRKIVKRVYKLILSSEYKRRQSPPGVKLTGRSFGKERRYPITNAFYEE